MMGAKAPVVIQGKMRSKISRFQRFYVSNDKYIDKAQKDALRGRRRLTRVYQAAIQGKERGAR